MPEPAVNVDVAFDEDGTPILDVQPVARASLVYDPEAKRELLVGDWRARQEVYRVPPHLRIPAQAGVGQETRCTEALCRKVENLIVSGVAPMAAKSTAGIPRAMWNEWSKKAKNEQPIYWHFMERVKLAMAFREAKLTRVIGAAAEHPDPKVAVPAAKDMLVYTNPKYAPKTTKRVEVHASMSIDVRHLQAIATMQPAQLVGMLRQIPAVGMREWTEAAAPIEGEVVGPGEEEDEG